MLSSLWLEKSEVRAPQPCLRLIIMNAAAMATATTKSPAMSRGLCDAGGGVLATTLAADETASSPGACNAIRRTTGRGLLADHLSKWALGLDLRSYDLILTLTEGHKHRLPTGRTFTIKEYVGTEGDVEDPVGRPPEEYDRCCSELSVLVDRVIEKLTA